MLLSTNDPGVHIDDENSIIRVSTFMMCIHMLWPGPQISSKQLRDDLMTMLIAGHETTAAVLTWTVHCLVQSPQYITRLQAEVSHACVILTPVLGSASPAVLSHEKWGGRQGKALVGNTDNWM